MGFMDLLQRKPSEFAQIAIVKAVLARSKPGTYGEVIGKVLLPLIENDVPITEVVKGGVPSIDAIFKLLDKPVAKGDDPIMVKCPHCNGFHLTETK